MHRNFINVQREDRTFNPHLQQLYNDIYRNIGGENEKEKVRCKIMGSVEKKKTGDDDKLRVNGS